MRLHSVKLSLALLCFLAMPVTAPAGSLDAPGAPTGGSGMPTMADIYNRLDTGTTGTAPGAFREPLNGPTVGTGRTLVDIQNRLPVADTTNGALTGDVLQGKTFWGVRTDGTWGLKSGTVPLQTLDPASSAVPAGYYAVTNLAVVDADLAAAKIRSGATIFGVSGSLIQATGNAPAAYVLTGTTFSNAAGAGLTGTMPYVGSFSAYPGTTSTPIPVGYHDGTGSVAGDSNLTVGNIRIGKTIFGVAGNLTDLALAKRVNKTGQTGCWDSAGSVVSPCAGTGQDGQYLNGIDPAIAPAVGNSGAYTMPPWTGVRFTDNGNATVTDNLTALIWPKNANLPVIIKTWQGALDYVADMNNSKVGNFGATDWRLPNINELHSLVDLTRTNPALPVGHPFTTVRASYWSSTTNGSFPNGAWFVGTAGGLVDYDKKMNGSSYVWPVRGGL